MSKIKGFLLKPLDGAEIGDPCEFLEGDFKRLEAQGAVKRGGEKAAAKSKNKAKAKPKNKAAAKPKNKSAG